MTGPRRWGGRAWVGAAMHRCPAWPLLSSVQVCVCVVMPGCTVTRQLTAPVEDYALYRAVRTAPTLEQKLKASARYLDQMSDGRWAGEVRAWFDDADGDYYHQARFDHARLKAYLKLVPNGPRSALGRARLQEFERALRAEALRDERIARQACTFERQLARAAQQRQELLAVFMRFARHLAQIRTWGRPTSELDHQFLVDWRLRPPRARCQANRCAKIISQRYAIGDGRGLSTRRAVFEVTLQLHRGGVARAALTGPELFSRLAEVEQRRPVDPDDPLGRAEAIAEAVAMVELAVGDAFPAERCAQNAISPVVLLRECDGVRLELIAGASPEHDRIEVEPLGSPLPVEGP